MNQSIALAVASVAIFAALTILASPRFRCWSAGHNWSRPRTEGGIRTEECIRCWKARKHDKAERATPDGLTQASLDGTPAREGMYASAIPADEVDAVRAESAKLQAEAAEAFRRATGTESSAVS